MLVDYSDSDESEPAERQHGSVDLSSGGKAVKPSSKREHSDKEEHTSSKKFKVLSQAAPPPLPSSFFSTYATNTRTSTSDDPTLHGGRTRQVPHLAGNWPTHVYIEWYPSKTELETLDRVIEQARSQFNDTTNAIIQGLLHSELGVQLPLHISLSVPLVLRTDQKDEFSQKISNALAAAKIFTFETRPALVKWVANFDASRYFLVLALNQPDSDALNRVLHVCNTTCESIGLNLLYEPQYVLTIPNDAMNQGSLDTKHDTYMSKHSVPDRTSAFHISIAWSLSRPSRFDSDQDLLASTMTKASAVMKIQIKCDIIKVKMGNVIQDIPLAKS